MKIYSNNPIAATAPWKNNQVMIAINHRENLVSTPEDEGKRFEADFTVAETSQEEKITEAAQRMLQDESHDANTIYGFTAEKKQYSGAAEISSAAIIFDENFIKEAEIIKSKNSDADGNIKKLAGKIKNYVADMTDGVRSQDTDSDVEQLINDGNVIITNEAN